MKTDLEIWILMAINMCRIAWPSELFDMMNYVFYANLSMGGGKLLVLLLVILWFVSAL